MGNLGEVYKAVEVGDMIGYGDARPLDAEMVGGVTPNWHAWESLPGHEHIFAAHLAGRRFMVYVPEIEEDEIKRGRKVTTTKLLFRGYVFVFVWDINRHRSRIESCPGAYRLVCLCSGEPAVISDADIHNLQRQENRRRPLKAMLEIMKKPKRRWRNKRIEIREELIHDNEIVSVRCRDSLRDVYSLDSDGRNQALRRALGLA